MKLLMYIVWTAVFAVGVGIPLNTAIAQSVRSLVNDGNALYDNNSYADAEVNYRKALEKDVTSVPGNFNLGNSLYKQDKYEEATKSFEDAVQKSKTTSAKAKAYYNLGDAHLKAQKYEEAVKSLTESLKLNPYDYDAKYNLSYALTKLRDQQQQQKSDKNQNKDQDKKDQDKQQNQDQNKQNENKQDEQKQDPDQKNEQKPQQQQPQQQERQISKADAERILDVLKNNEKEVQKKLRQRVAGRPKTDKDW